MRYELDAAGAVGAGSFLRHDRRARRGRHRRDQGRRGGQPLRLRARRHLGPLPRRRAARLLELPEDPHNLAWGDADARDLYVTALTSVYRLRLAPRHPARLKPACNARPSRTTVRRVQTPPTAPTSTTARAEDPDAPLLAALRAGDEPAFATLVTRYHATLKRVARAYVSTDAVAEEVVQETWLAVIAGLDRFEQRSTLKTWIFHILANKAKTRGMRERRIVPFASLARDDDEPAVSPDRFQRDGDAWPGHWATPAAAVGGPRAPARVARGARAAARRDRRAARRSRRCSPCATSRAWTPTRSASCSTLSAGNQRVILHRARARVRKELERYFEEAA